MAPIDISCLCPSKIVTTLHEELHTLRRFCMHSWQLRDNQFSHASWFGVMVIENHTDGMCAWYTQWIESMTTDGRVVKEQSPLRQTDTSETAWHRRVDTVGFTMRWINKIVSAWILLETGADAVPSATCNFEGMQIYHQQVFYISGRSYKRGSIYVSCMNGELSCYEDMGLADAPREKNRRLECYDAANDRRKLGVAVELEEDKWPNGIVWYRISSDFDDNQRRILHQAISMYEATDVNVTFKECEPPTLCNNKYVDMKKEEDACYSYVGYVDDGEPQIFNLGDSCFDGVGTAVHEVGHALGLYHEHTHPQREVIVLTDMDLPVSSSNYAKETDALLKPYDKASIMHYGRTAALCLPKDEYALVSFCDVEITTNCTMPLQKHCNDTRDHEIGQRDRLSEGDIASLKALYGVKHTNPVTLTPLPTSSPTQAPPTDSPSTQPPSPTQLPTSTPVTPTPASYLPSPAPSDGRPTSAKPKPSGNLSPWLRLWEKITKNLKRFGDLPWENGTGRWWERPNKTPSASKNDAHEETGIVPGLGWIQKEINKVLKPFLSGSARSKQLRGS